MLSARDGPGGSDVCKCLGRRQGCDLRRERQNIRLILAEVLAEEDPSRGGEEAAYVGRCARVYEDPSVYCRLLQYGTGLIAAVEAAASDAAIADNPRNTRQVSGTAQVNAIQAEHCVLVIVPARNRSRCWCRRSRSYRCGCCCRCSCRRRRRRSHRNVAVSPSGALIYAYDAAIEASSIIPTAIPSYESGASAVLARNEDVSAQPCEIGRRILIDRI